MNVIHLKPRSISRQWNIEQEAEKMRSEGIDVLVVSNKTKTDNRRGRAMTSGELLALLYHINRCEE